jgi:hypothetical protein
MVASSLSAYNRARLLRAYSALSRSGGLFSLPPPLRKASAARKITFSLSKTLILSGKASTASAACADVRMGAGDSQSIFEGDHGGLQYGY